MRNLLSRLRAAKDSAEFVEFLSRVKKRLPKYLVVALTSFGFNQLAFYNLHQHGVRTEFANFIAFIVGGQINFVFHDQWTFRDQRAESHWLSRWWQFVVGNVLGLSLNTGAAFVLVSLGYSARWVNLGALAASFGVNLAWNLYVSHRPRGKHEK